MNWSKDLGKIKKNLPYVVLFSAVMYLSAIMLQFGYYSAFNIDVLMINPRVDPASLLSVVTIIIAAIAVAVQIHGIRWMEKSRSIVVPVIEDLLTIYLLIMMAFALNVNLPKGYFLEDMKVFMACMLGVGLLGLYGLRVAKAITLRKEGYSWRDTYVQSAIIKFGMSVDRSNGKKKMPLWIPYLVVMSMLVFCVPYATGWLYADARKDFPKLKEISDQPQGTFFVVIGQTVDGYVVKEYNKKNDVYTGSWGIVKENRMILENVAIKSLTKQRLEALTIK